MSWYENGNWAGLEMKHLPYIMAAVCKGINDRYQIATDWLGYTGAMPTYLKPDGVTEVTSITPSDWVDVEARTDVIADNYLRAYNAINDMGEYWFYPAAQMNVGSEPAPTFTPVTLYSPASYVIRTNVSPWLSLKSWLEQRRYIQLSGTTKTYSDYQHISGYFSWATIDGEPEYPPWVEPSNWEEYAQSWCDASWTDSNWPPSDEDMTEYVISNNYTMPNSTYSLYAEKAPVSYFEVPFPPEVADTRKIISYYEALGDTPSSPIDSVVHAYFPDSPRQFPYEVTVNEVSFYPEYLDGYVRINPASSINASWDPDSAYDADGACNTNIICLFDMADDLSDSL